VTTCIASVGRAVVQVMTPVIDFRRWRRGRAF